MENKESYKVTTLERNDFNLITDSYESALEEAKEWLKKDSNIEEVYIIPPSKNRVRAWIGGNGELRTETLINK